MSVTTAILRAIVATLESCKGFERRVRRGTPEDAATPPCAWVAMGELVGSNGPNLTGHQCDLTVNIWATGVAPTSSRADREDAAADLASQITCAIVRDTHLLSLLTITPTVGFRPVLEDGGLGGGFYVVGVVELQFMMDNSDGGI